LRRACSAKYARRAFHAGLRGRRAQIQDYINELVHVTQYATTGRTHFLTSYFGLSALTIAKRFIMRDPINMMRSSPHENQAYDLEQRFLEWYATHK